jgi:thymidylate synthase (FAD)
MKISLLDHGYLELVESWGSDERIVESARMSTAKGFLGWGPKCRTCGDAFHAPERQCPSPTAGREFVDVGRGGHIFDAPGDEKLLRYLWEHKHATPFEMAGLVVEVQAPIFVFREWHRHRTQSYNELSARYTPLPDLNYVPTVERLMLNAGGTNKQAGTVGGAATLTEAYAEQFRWELEKKYVVAEELYQWALRNGIPKELARIHIPVGRYSRMRASANLRNWLAFLTLRMATEAQWEIRQYANAVGALVAERFPRTWELFARPAGS